MTAGRARMVKSRANAGDLLQTLVGTWRTEGQLVGVPEGPQTTLLAVDRYDWVPGVRLLAHYVSGHLGRTSVASFEVWAYAPRNRSYVSTSFDENGVPSTFKSRFKNGEWTIVGKSQRFRGNFSRDRLTLTGTWHQRIRGRWKPWMTITLRKAGA